MFFCYITDNDITFVSGCRDHRYTSVW
ncbi:hypothetical protein [Klebsiella pneumoniae]